MNGPVLRARGVSKRYRRRLALRAADLAVRPGQSVAVVGENGAGKTTLLRICAGLVTPDSGTVERRGRTGYCPQEPTLVETLTAAEHLVLFGRAAGLGRSAALAQGGRILDTFGFPTGERALVRELSGGTRQKLNLALALLGEPDILLLDEPYQGFDHGSYVDFWDLVDRWRRRNRAVVVVTHMLAETHRVDQVIELGTLPGRPRFATEGAAP